jgi:FlaA1/EpsC-like NDP-sugar epimerase
LPLALRVPVLVSVYALILSAASYLALALRFDFEVPPDFFQRWVRSVWWIVPLKLVLLGLFGQYRSLLTFFSFPDAGRIFYAMGIAFAVQLAVWFLTGGVTMIPRGTIVVDFVLSFVGLAGLRAAMRMIREKSAQGHFASLPSRRVAIIGAGPEGAALAREIRAKPGLGMEVVCFIDADPNKVGRTLHGLQVLGGHQELVRIAAKLDLAKCILAMPEASPALIREMIDALNEAGIDHAILPPVDALLERRSMVGHLRHVSPEDLLGREPVSIDQAAIGRLMAGEVVLVTGAGGSIGSELCRQIAAHAPAKLILVERSEPALFALEQELARDFKEVTVEPLAVDVCDSAGMESVHARWKPAFVFHAAAHKHVPLMERQPAEAIWNNALGTLSAARAAMAHGCKKFVLVSTDKAVNPAGVMGATKLLAELCVGELQESPGHGTAFCSVRFGNVLDSSGSVVRVFRDQIASGGPVTVTHPDIERYFMSIPEAVGLVLQSATFAQGGEVFVLEMGRPVKIRDLARQMIELSGFAPGRDIPIEFTGLRPGEKMTEESTRGDESRSPTAHPKIHKLTRSSKAPAVIDQIEKTAPRLRRMEAGEVRAWLRGFAEAAES